MKRNRPGRARRGDRPTYELMMGMFTGALGCAAFSGAPNARYGPQDFARCIVQADGKNVASVAEARRYAPKEAEAKNDVPSGEWLRLRTAGVLPHEAVGAFNRFTRRVACNLRLL